jgi:3-hydroxy-9,10-secoandrosta-1,3,5(10)-triene-9,17-dione monooxygenase
MAQGVVDAFAERALVRREPHTREPAFERPSTQLDFAEATAEVDGARRVLRKVHADELAISAAGGLAPIEERARIRRDIAYANRLCVRAVDRLTSSGDSSALYDEHAVHRLARDARASALQFAIHWGETAVQYSRVCWGLEPQTMLI